MTYRFPCTITDVFERKEKRHLSGAGDATVFETVSAGWYLQLDGLISIYVGVAKPEVARGDKLIMKLERSPS